MPTPTGPERRLLAAGAKKSTTWGTAVALGAGSGINTKGITGYVRVQDYLIAAEVDSALARSGQLDVIKPIDATIQTDMLYDPGALGTLIALLWGTAGNPAQQGGTAAWLHKFQLADTNWNKIATMAVEFPGIIHEMRSCKPIEWTMKAAGSGIVGSELKVRGDQIIDDSGVNGATQMDSLTYDDRENRVLFRHSAVKMNAASAGDVSGETALVTNNIEVSIKRQGYDSVHPAGQYGIIEPAEGGYPDFRVKISFPRFDAVNKVFMATAIAETLQKMTVTFIGPLIASTYYYTYKFYFPKMRMMIPEASWDEIVKNGLELIAEEASAAPTGMAHTRPYVEITNKRTTDYLA